ncbi:hypothetical protein [Micromonospora rhizosphaerae]|uniref:hypothetical protein n=1 Tax=Micromonospora rhizosphaerae TaxID=568872 RepID=UPI000AD2D7E9|nr:hypothetical protein [Micromonospora rhizosphaerae]
MDRFEGRCWLDWWANSSTLLGSVEVAVVITAADAGWEARGRLVSDSDEDQEAFAFLCDLDPVFMLRFEDESTVAVTRAPQRRTSPLQPHRVHRSGSAIGRESHRPVGSIGPSLRPDWLDSRFRAG